MLQLSSVCGHFSGSKSTQIDKQQFDWSRIGNVYRTMRQPFTQIQQVHSIEFDRFT